MLVCWNCGESLDEIPRPIRRSASCQHCRADLHCCRLCRHYDERLTARCDDERADPPTNKEGANFCEFFTPRSDAYEAARGGRQNAARSALDALFGGGEEAESAAPDPAEDARAKLDALFGKPSKGD